jgi:NADP-dependent 3-hydroxy acid dehydrogenase YdfG
VNNEGKSQLQNKVAVVTGASSGFGQLIAETLAANGATLFICGRSKSGLEETRARIENLGGHAEISAFDIRDTAALREFIQQASQFSDRLDLLVNNAGFGYMDDILDGNPDQWREMYDVNVIALLGASQAAIEQMRKINSSGRIINISSTAVLRRDTNVYGTTKHAVNAISSSLRKELEDDAIRVTAIMPGVFSTNFIRTLGRDAILGMADAMGIDDLDIDADNKLSRASLEKIHKRMGSSIGDPQHVANAVLYVATQPVDIEIEELIIRPPKALQI